MFEESPLPKDAVAPESSFVLDKDSLDSILLEAQQLSPTEKAKLDELSIEANRKIAAEFSGIVKPIPDIEIPGKYIYVDKETMTELEDLWAPSSDSNRSYAERSETAGRAFLHEGHFVVQLPYDTEFWDNLTTDNKQTLIEDNGTEENAKSIVKRAMNLNILLHEGTHLYQLPVDSNTELYLLRETQANWSEKEFTTEADRVSRADADKKGKFYQSLIDKYGKAQVHEYALTGNIQVDPWLTFDIDQEFTEEVVNDLFPNLKNG